MNTQPCHHLRILLLACLLLTLIVPAAATAQDRVALLPFTAHADRDMGYLTNGLRDMLASRLTAQAGVEIVPQTALAQALAGKAAPTDPAGLRQLGNKLQADYLLVGSLTALAGSLSLDSTLHSVKGEGAPRTFYATAAREEMIIAAIDTLSWQIAEQAFGKQRPAAAPGTGVAPMPATGAEPNLSAHPDRLLMGQNQNAGSAVLRPLGVVTGALGFSKSQDFNYGIVSLEAGDVDGDGQDEYVIAAPYEVRVYRRTDNRYQKIAQASLGRRFAIHAISLGDINQNGRQEIFVSAADAKEPNSLILEWDGKDLAHIADNLSWYLRVMEMPGQGKFLAGQKAGLNAPFAKGVFRVELNQGQISKGDELPSGGMNLFDFSYADLEGNGGMQIVAINQGDRLLVINPGGKVLWTSDDFYGGTTRFVGGPSFDELNKDLEHGRNEAPRIYIPARIVIRDVNNDGRADVIINKNLSSASRIMARTRSYPSGEIHALTWNGISLSDLWQTRKIEGYIADYQLGPVQVTPAQGSTPQQLNVELNVGVVLNSSGFDILGNADSAVLTFPLRLTGDEGKAQGN